MWPSNLPGADGMEGTRRLLAALPSVRVATDFVTKDSPITAMVDAIRAAADQG